MFDFNSTQPADKVYNIPSGALSVDYSAAFNRLNIDTTKIVRQATPDTRAVPSTIENTLANPFFGLSGLPYWTDVFQIFLAKVPIFIPPTPPPVVTTYSYVPLAELYARFTVSGTQTVRFGAGDKWLEQTVTDVGWCDTNFFGGDPAPGQNKTCQLRVATQGTATTIGRSRTASTYTWEGPININPTWLAANGYGNGVGDVLIQNRNFKSIDPKIAAVSLNMEFGRRVKFKNCNFSAFSWNGGGAYGGCILTQSGQAKVNLDNCLLFGGLTNPMYEKAFAGRALTAQYCQEIIVTNCEMIGTSGISILEFAGDKSGNVPTIKINNNKFIEIDGRISDPTNAQSNYYRQGNEWLNGSDSDFVIANMVQLDQVKNVPNVQIYNNEAVSTANKSRFEDIVSFYLTSGTAASPIHIKGNLLRGGYVFDRWCNFDTALFFGNNMPANTPGSGVPRGYPNSGGGGLLGDGDGSDYTKDPAYIKFEDNDVLDMSNYGIGIASGHDMTLKDNRIFRSGFVHGITRDIKLSWGHVAIQIQDYYTGGGASIDDGTGTNTKRVRWYNNDAIGNVYGYVWRKTDGTISTPGLLVNSPLRTNRDNIDVTAGLTGTQAGNLVTKQYVDNIAADRKAKWATANIVVGLAA